MLKWLWVGGLMLGVWQAGAQERCATVALEQQRQQKNPRLEKDDQFESWMQEQQRKPRMFGLQRGQNTTLVIPVVVHVIHLPGDAVGSGRNISDAQILSQVSVLNRDFKRLNADAANTPSVFQSVVGSIDIEFVLAKRTPEGLPTTGIVRVPSSRASFDPESNNQELKALSYWPAEDYLNIWVADLTGSNLGYAQFPISNLPGTNEGPRDRLTDGVVVDFTVFGSVEEGAFPLSPQFNRGRTATHEVGHYLGLRHIWGDVSGCSGTDFVADTPNQSNPTSGCPAHPVNNVCDPLPVMFQNYMDYSNDVCMNLFTAGQVSRMQVVLDNSPRRVTLAASPGALPPVLVAHDLGIREIKSPRPRQCGTGIEPKIEIRNYGTNAITSARIQMRRNGTPAETRDLVLSLAPAAIAEVTFAPQDFEVAGSVIFDFEILQTNGGPDGKATDNLRSVTVEVPPMAALPLTESFSTFPAGWHIDNPDDLFTWQLSAANGGSLFINLYDYEDVGARDRLVSPRFTITDPVALVRFDRAHAPFPGQVDRLRILVSTTCDFSSGALEIFNKAGSDLATTSQRTSPFSPAASDWLSEVVPLNGLSGQTVQLAYEVENGFGNNLYLDNVAVSGDDVTDAAVVEIVQPSPVTCAATVVPAVQIRNTGVNDIVRLEVRSFLNGQSPIVTPYNISALPPGQATVLNLPTRTLSPGNNVLQATIVRVNDIPDADESNNSLLYRTQLNTATDRIPLRQNFNQGLAGWAVVSQGTQPLWALTPTNKGSSLVYPAFSTPQPGFSSWLVSPVLNFATVEKASMLFSLSYANRPGFNDELRLLVSEDCGITFEEAALVSTSEMAVGSAANSWIPAVEQDWQTGRFLNLSQYVGNPLVRVAFVADNGNGNNIYLDDIEFFLSDQPNPPRPVNAMVVYYGDPSFRISFNLAERQNIRLQIFNSMGQMMLENDLPLVLNQTFEVDARAWATGVYIVRSQGNGQSFTQRIFISGR